MTSRPWTTSSVLAAALLTFAAPSLAQSPSPIRQGFDAAWARKPEQRAAALRKEAAAAAETAARRWTPGPPALEVTGKSDHFNRNIGVREYDATVAVPLWLPGERSRAQAAASAGVASLEAQLLAAQWRLAEEVRAAYWSHVRARLEQGLAQQRLISAQQIAADVARRVRAGDLARADGHQAESAVAGAESAVAETGIALAEAAHAWGALTGLSPSSSRAEPRPAAGIPAHPALTELSSKAGLARRQRELASVQSWANPELTVGAASERGSYGERHGQSIIVGVRIPLGKSSGSQARSAGVSADLVEAEAQLELEEQRVRSRVEASNARVKALEVAQTAAERRAMLARESRGFFDKSFRLGESDLPTRLRVELDAFEAERQAARGRVELDAAVSQLRQALGLLPE